MLELDTTTKQQKLYTRGAAAAQQQQQLVAVEHVPFAEAGHTPCSTRAHGLGGLGPGRNPVSMLWGAAGDVSTICICNEAAGLRESKREEGSGGRVCGHKPCRAGVPV